MSWVTHWIPLLLPVAVVSGGLGVMLHRLREMLSGGVAVPPEAQQLYERLTAAGPLAAFPPGTVQYGIAGWPNTNPYMTQPCILVITPANLEIYNFDGTRMAYSREDIQWYGLPPADSEAGAQRAAAVVLHVFTHGRWFQVLLMTQRAGGGRGGQNPLLDALSYFKAPPSRETAYSPFAPALARVTNDHQHPGVLRGEKVRLWFSPLELVVLRGTTELLRIPAEHIDRVLTEAVDASPDYVDGVVRIRARGRVLEYALPDYAAFAAALIAATSVPR